MVHGICILSFLKQKTAYEMRISDWSSDVCSSDLGGGAAAAIVATEEVARRLGGPMIEVVASQQRSETYTEGHGFLGAVIGPSQMTRDTAADCYEQAGRGPRDIDLVQVNDRFTVAALWYYRVRGY